MTKRPASERRSPVRSANGKHSPTRPVPESKRPPKEESFLAFVLDQLDGVDGIEQRPMFGGIGLYHDDQIFALIHKGRLFFKVSTRALPEFVRHGMKPFTPRPNQVVRSYYEVPLVVLENRSDLKRWARRAWVGR